MVEWHHRLNWHEFEQGLGVGDGWGGLVCCGSWGRKESDTTEQLNWTELRQHIKKQRYYFANKGSPSQSYGFCSSHVWMWYLDYKESWAQKNWCFWTMVLEKTPESPLDCKEIQPVHPKEISPEYSLEKDWCWSWNSNTLVIWCKELTYLKRPWCWERLKVGGEGDNRGWVGWMASLTQWTWVWTRSRSWWWMGKPGMVQSMGLQRVTHDWATEMNWAHSLSLTWTLLDRLLISTLLSSSSRVLSFCLFQIYSSVSSLCWILYFYFCELCRSSVFSGLVEWVTWGRSHDSQQRIPFSLLELYAPRLSPVWAV